jgi:uncharacterized membrane protein required for colicin V production
MSITWPDLVIGAIVLLFALKGFKRGFVAELAGAVALAIAIAAAFWYNGAFDAFVQNITHIGPGSSHVIGMVIFAIIVYIAVLAVSWLLGRIAKLPIVNIGNAAAGAIVGAAKAVVGVWAVLYIVLFFPLPADLHNDLHNSIAANAIAQPNDNVDNLVRAQLPWFVRPFMAPVFGHHRL